MSKTFKTCAIFFFTAVWLVVMRIVIGEVTFSDNVSDWVFSALVQIFGMGVVPVVLYKFWVRESVIKGFSLNIRINPLLYLLAIVIGLVLHFAIRSFSILWQNVVFLLGYTPTNSGGTIYSGPEVLVMSLLCTAVLPGIFEELTYRGLGKQMLSKVKNEKVVIIVMGLLFGLGHQFILQTGYAFLAGCVFAFLAIKTRSILPGMIIHFINNALSVISEYSEQRNNAYHAFEKGVDALLYGSMGKVAITLVASVAVLVLLLLLVKKLSSKKMDDGEKEEETTVFFPKTTQYVDELFGSGFSEIKVVQKSAAWYEYAFLYGAIALMVITTYFSFAWGLMR